MRREEISLFETDYTIEGVNEFQSKFDIAIESSSTESCKLAKKIYDDLDLTKFGISWWNNLTFDSKSLIGDYLLQSVKSIDTNLTEAKLHFFELLSAREQINKKEADLIVLDSHGNPQIHFENSTKPLDDLSYQLEELHICGFFRAIGSTLDCLATSIAGVLGIETNLRKVGLNTIEKFLGKSQNFVPTRANFSVLVDFKDFYTATKSNTGPVHFIEWAIQYRNMFVHRGRRNFYYELAPSEINLFGADGLPIPRVQNICYLSKYPFRTEIEALIKTKEILINEKCEVTLEKLFKSVKSFVDAICGKLIEIWELRKAAPTLILQPVKQWEKETEVCDFIGYEPSDNPVGASLIVSNPEMLFRVRVAGLDDKNRNRWAGTFWER
jgi:hypothetical protein